MKSKRQNEIIRLIASRDIETQEELASELRALGYKVTQATVSRDMRELRLVKKLNDDGSYQYVCPEEPVEAPDHSARLRTIFRESVASCATAQNLVIVKTLSGLANAACAAIDSMDVSGMVGSLAGDDTIFLAMTDNAAAERFCEEIRELIR